VDTVEQQRAARVRQRRQTARKVCYLAWDHLLCSYDRPFVRADLRGGFQDSYTHLCGLTALSRANPHFRGVCREVAHARLYSAAKQRNWFAVDKPSGLFCTREVPDTSTLT